MGVGVKDGHDLPPLVELAALRQAVYVKGKKVFSHDYLKRLTPLSLAIWYMDDGTFSLRAKGVQKRTRDGRRFIVSTAVEETAPTPMTVVLNWNAGFKQ